MYSILIVFTYFLVVGIDGQSILSSTSMCVFLCEIERDREVIARLKKKNNKKHSENADTSSSVIFDNVAIFNFRKALFIMLTQGNYSFSM